MPYSGGTDVFERGQISLGLGGSAVGDWWSSDNRPLENDDRDDARILYFRVLGSASDSCTEI